MTNNRMWSDLFVHLHLNTCFQMCMTNKCPHTETVIRAWPMAFQIIYKYLNVLYGSKLAWILFISTWFTNSMNLNICWRAFLASMSHYFVCISHFNFDLHLFDPFAWNMAVCYATTNFILKIDVYFFQLLLFLLFCLL